MVNHPNRSKTTPFHEGQGVEVAVPGSGKVWKRDQTRRTWRKAKIVRRAMQYIGCSKKEDITSYDVQFPDCSRAVFDAEHIRAIVHLPKDAKVGDCVIVEGPAVVYK